MQQGGRFCGYGCFGINFVRQLTKVRGHFGLQRGVEEEIFSEPFYFTLILSLTTRYQWLQPASFHLELNLSLSLKCLGFLGCGKINRINRPRQI